MEMDQIYSKSLLSYSVFEQTWKTSVYLEPGMKAVNCKRGCVVLKKFNC